jgi:ATP-dependent HslUV protease ATP-binding subunit HslU
MSETQGPLEDLTPRQIVAELDKYIVGQAPAKRTVAIALRNRIRRRRLPPELRDEVVPKNILMIGPTGVGKTEIARRIARLVRAPFVKVEATKFTEVGYVGRDVDSMVRDLVETAIRMVKAERMADVQDRAQELAEERLLDILAPLPRREPAFRNPFEALFGGPRPAEEDDRDLEERRRAAREQRAEMRRRLATGELEGQVVEIDVEDSTPPVVEVFSGAGVEEMGINLQDLLGGMLPKRRKRRRVTVAEARRLLAQEEAQKLIDMDAVVAEAVRRAEQAGIIFIDEIDKIAGRDGGAGPDVSREGVQRDILPIVEGSTVMTKYGPVRTDHILFIAAGAFHVSKPTDLIPELQGRFPLRVELEPLGKADLRRILVEPENALTKQYAALLATEGVELVFADDGLDAIAEVAQYVNDQTENIGARRLHTVMEKLLEDVSFEAPEGGPRRVVVDAAYVRERLSGLARDRDLSRYVL